MCNPNKPSTAGQKKIIAGWNKRTEEDFHGSLLSGPVLFKNESIFHR